MDTLNINNTSQNISYNYTNATASYHVPRGVHYKDILYVVTWAIISISLPLTLVSVYFVVRNNQGVLLYVINLLISGVIQLCCLIDRLENMSAISLHIYWYAEIASVCFMVCVALERYLVLAHPLWYHFSRSIKVYVMVCVVVWLLPLAFVLPFYFHTVRVKTTLAIFHLLPLPLFIFFLVGALKALSAAIHVSSVEKRRIIGTLLLPILIYSLLFMPFVIRILLEDIGDDMHLILIAFIFLYLSPLANVVLYVFIRRGTLDKVLASLCCCKMDSDENSPK